MSDNTIIAFIGFATVLAAGIPTTASALLSKQARDHAATAATVAARAKETIGEINGNGDAMTMLARSLAQNMELLRGQEKTVELEQELFKLHKYAETQIHRLNGQVGMMWRDFAVAHGVDPKDLPPPAPSPNPPHA